MAAKFEIRSPKRGEYTWVLTSQGRTLAIGSSYTTKAAAHNAIASFRKGAPGAAVADLTLPPPKSAPRKVARAAGRLAARAVIKGAEALEPIGSSTTRRAAKANAAKPTSAAAKRGSRAG